MIKNSLAGFDAEDVGTMSFDLTQSESQKLKNKLHKLI